MSRTIVILRINSVSTVPAQYVRSSPTNVILFDCKKA